MGSTIRRIDRATSALLLLALLAGLTASSLWSSRLRNAQAEERDDLNLFLEASSAGWAEATERFFAVPESTAELIIALEEDAETDDERVRLLAEGVRSGAALDATFVGQPNGDFLFVARSDEEADGGFRTRRIATEPEREVLATWTDSALVEQRRELDTEDEYDPTARPWFLRAGDVERWTSPYQFASSGDFGITYSARNQETGAVVGVDMRLAELGGFLDALKPGENGVAVVVADTASDGLIVIGTSTTDGAPSSLAEIDDTLAGQTMLFDSIHMLEEQLEAGGDAFVRIRSEDDRRTMVTRRARADQDWFLVVQAVDSDFLDGFSNRSLNNLFGIIAIGLATAIIVASLAFAIYRYRSMLKREAERDGLTGLLSRRAIQKRLDRSVGGRGLSVVAIVDLDKFKSVNDEYGHLVGDKVLTEISRRIQAFADQTGAAVGRLGGDEFAILSDQDLDWPVLVALLAQQVDVDDVLFDIGGSVGVAHSDALADRSVEELLRAADRALFTVKRAGGSGHAVDGQSLVVPSPR